MSEAPQNDPTVISGRSNNKALIQDNRPLKKGLFYASLRKVPTDPRQATLLIAENLKQKP